MEDVVEIEIIDEGGEIMPGGDRTGPDGKGPKTGRGLGKAAGNNMGRSKGQGQGQGQGRNVGNSRSQGTGRGRNRNR